MFDEVLDVVIVAVVALLGLAPDSRWAKCVAKPPPDGEGSEVDALRGSCEAMKDDNARLAAQVAQAKAQSEGLLQQLSFAKSQLAQAQQAEQVRVQRERERAEADGLRRREEQEKALTEQGKVLSALAPLQKNLDELQQKVSNIEEGRKHEMGVLGEQLKGWVSSRRGSTVRRARSRRHCATTRSAALGESATAQHCGVRRFAGARRLRYAGGDDWRRR